MQPVMPHSSQNQPRAFLKLNEELAAEAGKSTIIDQAGGYEVTINSAVFVTSSKGNQGIQITGEDAEGRAVRYLDIYYQTKDGSDIKAGQALIQAIMYLNGIQDTTFVETTENGQKLWHVPELQGAKAGMVLTRRTYKKDNGEQGWNMNIRQVYEYASGCTVEEIQNGEATGTAVPKLLASLD